MLDTAFLRSALTGAPSSTGSAPATRALRAGWREGLALINLRGDPADAAFLDAAKQALRVALPLDAGTARDGTALRIVRVGPDDWFVIGGHGEADALMRRLRTGLAGLHAAATDVSSGYTVLRLSGDPVREVLAQGCPLDLHPRAFRAGQAAGSHWFRASVWLWQLGDEPGFELLVRRSFMGYVWLMLQQVSAECGLTTGS